MLNILDEEGYTDSQTWEAWQDSLQVFWDNTEIFFLVSVSLSLGAVIFTLLYCPRANVYETLVEETSPPSSVENEELENSAIRNDSRDGEGVQGKLTPGRQILTQEIEANMSQEERERERLARNEQLEAIYKLMQKQKEKFGDTSIEDIKDQMKFYC